MSHDGSLVAESAALATVTTESPNTSTARRVTSMLSRWLVSRAVIADGVAGGRLAVSDVGRAVPARTGAIGSIGCGTATGPIGRTGTGAISGADLLQAATLSVNVTGITNES